MKTSRILASVAFAGFLAVALFGFFGWSVGIANADSGSFPPCERRVLEYGRGQVLVQKNIPVGGCVWLVFPQEGSVLMAGGVFTAPLHMDGGKNGIVPTSFVPGQVAPQIIPFRWQVKAGEEWIFFPTYLETGTELALGFDYDSPEEQPVVTRRQYLPLMLKPISILLDTRTLGPSAETQLIYKKWPEAVKNQITCLEVKFALSKDAQIDSGWIFGSNLQAKVDGRSYDIKTYLLPGEPAKQISMFVLPKVREFQICVEGTGTGNEIGLRIKYPYNP